MDDTNNVYDVFAFDRQTSRVVRVSVNSQGQQGNDHSGFAVVCGSGRYAAFLSRASNLGGIADTNNDWDYFVHDLLTGKTVCVSRNDRGEIGNDGADCGCRVYKFPAISYDGRFVAYHTLASNLDVNNPDTNNYFDIYAHDRDADGNGVFDEPGGTRTWRVTTGINGQQANGHSWIRDMSPDGNWVAYHSHADNLVTGDTNAERDIFITNIHTLETILVSKSTSGELANDYSDSPRLNYDGSVVVYASLATNLDPRDRNNTWDVYAYDVATGETELVSRNTLNRGGDKFSRHPSISYDGRFVTFHSIATTHVPGDTNEVRDVFVHDRLKDETTALSVSSEGEMSNDRSYDAFINADGRYVVFDSWGTNLVPGDNNRRRDIFFRERTGNRLTLAGPHPGVSGQVNSFMVSGASPGAHVYVVAGLSAGSRSVPDCPSLAIDINGPEILGTAFVEGTGEAIISRTIPPRASGRTLYFQAVEETTCRVSNLVSHEF